MNDEKKMFQGDWQCSGCGGGIKELPFEPKGTANLTCRDCFKNKKSGNGGGSGAQQGERKMFQGNWECKDCSGAITELPFEPRSTSNLTCRECYRQNRAA